MHIFLPLGCSRFEQLTSPHIEARKSCQQVNRTFETKCHIQISNQQICIHNGKRDTFGISGTPHGLLCKRQCAKHSTLWQGRNPGPLAGPLNGSPREEGSLVRSCMGHFSHFVSGIVICTQGHISRNTLQSAQWASTMSFVPAQWCHKCTKTHKCNVCLWQY